MMGFFIGKENQPFGKDTLCQPDYRRHICLMKYTEELSLEARSIFNRTAEQWEIDGISVTPLHKDGTGICISCKAWNYLDKQDLLKIYQFAEKHGCEDVRVYFDLKVIEIS